jgi:hypothetical protein
MQSVHGTVWMVRRKNGGYAKSGSKEGSGYIMFETQALTKQWIVDNGLEGAIPIKARFSITPTHTGRAQRMVAVHSARPKVLSEADYKKRVEHNFYP